MAISPPSDLVLDVVRAADPAQVEAAQAKLKATRAAFAATSLAEKGAGFDAAVDILNSAGSKSGLANAASEKKVGEVPEVYRQFEGVVLQNFLKSMLPEDSEAVYGKGNAGEIWKSMMAEQIGAEISERGGIGIAEQMYSDMIAAQRGGKVANATTDSDDRNVAMSMIMELERKTLGIAPSENAQI
ncbi:rod-binding protein [Rhizobium sp. RU36D]|uniref:rod-binding protein n=1 Tax=Rhizobium sp. RU36D TaxID=1907415 RepID=UPI0009D90709|nr:rod-binding protein [Rhizobium sp. RU36D]SMC84889.1 Rod binding protein domain-containing protein [Rhizobium sp. RU36D]